MKTTTQKIPKDIPKESMDQLFSKMADYFGVLSEPSRLRIMYAICSGEKSVTEVIAHCGSSQANVSRHLSALHKAGILKRRKEGVVVYYAIADTATVDMCQTLCSKMLASLH